MRATGTLETDYRYGLHDHLCCGFYDPPEMAARAEAFLRDGLALGQRVGYIGGAAVDAMATYLDGIADHHGSRATFTTDVSEMYAHGQVVEPEAQVAAYTAATEAALRDGFTGLRVAADVTDLVRTAAQLEAFARYEHLTDRAMTQQPFAAMCAYSHATLDAETIAEVSAMHPVSNVDAPGFSLYAVPDATFALHGEIDATTIERFRRALARIVVDPDGAPIVVELTELAYIDHRGMLALVDVARRHGRTIVLRSASWAPVRLTELLELTDVTFERSA